MSPHVHAAVSFYVAAVIFAIRSLRSDSSSQAFFFFACVAASAGALV
jgi:hypothetical protein